MRDEAKRLGRNPDAIKGSNFLFNAVLTDSPSETGQAAEIAGQMLGQSAELVLQSPMSLIGTPDECITELKRRVENWGVTNFVLSAFTPIDEDQLRAWKDDVFSHV